MDDKTPCDGESKRRRVMGDAFVDRALNNTNAFNRPLQEYLNEHAWGAVWVREETLSLRERSMITLATLAALKAPTEIKGHVRGALRNGCSVEEIREVLLHTAPYIGAPAVQEAFRAALEVIDDEAL